MIKVQENYSLAPLTTFKIGGPARFFIEISSAAELVEALSFAKDNNLKILLIGGGSNMLVSDSGFKGLVISINILGINKIKEGLNFVEIKAGAGEIWDKVVDYAVSNNYWGIENLSYIPGKMGAFAVQNVGAYGQEASQVVTVVEAYDSQTNQVVLLTNKQCGFAYRTSVFNTLDKGRYFILQVLLRLSKIYRPNISYPDLQKVFANQDNIELSAIRQTIINVRNKKFPYPYTAGAKGSAGSFFKNFLLKPTEYTSLEKNIAANLAGALPELRRIKNKFPSGDLIKIPTAFILEICGIKGLTVGGAKVNHNQPLVILNDNNTTTAANVLLLVKKIRQIVKQTTGLSLQPEPSLIGFESAELLACGFTKEEVGKYII
ncbi:UDP-N-acetylmuramate dehydrogenase [Patescibacteria group bacterium]|nr:UDP-N-acetylmuramate dehydrogenase [Patescibacteria group bacterium]